MISSNRKKSSIQPYREICDKGLEELEKLVCKIHHVNAGWHISEALLGGDSLFSCSYRTRKRQLQKQLLTDFYEYLEILHDKKLPGEQRFYSIRLKSPLNEFSDACHIPERLLIEWNFFK